MIERPEPVLTPEQIAEYQEHTRQQAGTLANIMDAMAYAHKVHPIFQPGFGEEIARRQAELTAKMAAYGWTDEDEGGDDGLV